MDSIIVKSLKLSCSAYKAFDLFTRNDFLEQWLVTKAEVEPKAGGKYELFWNPDDRENDSTIGCKIIAIEYGKFLSFEWKGPQQFKHFMNAVQPLTNVTVFFIPNMTSTEVILIHSGWRDSEEWNTARQWFEKAWSLAFDRLKEVTL